MHWTRTRKRVAAIGAAVLMGGAATTALAYFVAQGTGSTTSNVIVGTAPVGSWAITAQASGMDTGLRPGVTEPTTSGGYEIDVTVDNTGTATQQLNAITATLTTDAAGGVYDVTSSAFVDACQASWFTVGTTTTWNPVPTFPQDVASGANVAYGVSVSMPANSTTDQSSCERLSPQISVAVS